MWGGGIATGCYQMSSTAITVDKYTPVSLTMPLANVLNSDNKAHTKNKVQYADNLDVVLYPNPMSDPLQIVINGNNEQPITLSLSDAFGRMVFQQKDAQSRMEINVSHFANGVYILTAKQGDKFVQRRVVKASGR